MSVFHIISLWLTGMVFYVSGKHIIDLYHPSKAAIKGRLSTFIHLICFGIFIGSLGDFLDNGYWGSAWTGDGLKHVSPVIAAIRDWLFKHGVIANIPFRQISDLASNYCIALAFIKLSETLADDERYKVISSKYYHRNLMFAAIFSAVVVGVITYIAHYG